MGPRQGEFPTELCGRSSDRRPMPERDSPRRTNGNAVANPRIRACSPTSSRPALSSARSIVLTNFTLVRVEKGYPVRIMLDLGHQSSAIRCRFVDRFARPKVLAHVARQRFSPRDAPLSSIGSRRDQFSDVISTMRALRLPTHASPVTYLFRFRGPCDSSSVRARRCQRSRAGGGPATGQDHCSAGDLKLPAHLHVDASGTSQVPRRPILCLCPAPRPRPDRRSLANNGRIRCCPCC